MEHLTDGYPDPENPIYLETTWFLDFETPIVQDFVAKALTGAEDAGDLEKSVKLFYAVRDDIRYDPYTISDAREIYRASTVLENGTGWCIPKAALLTACARAAGIPAGLGLSDVTNHLCTQRLRDVMGGVDLFIHHGYAVMYIAGQWVKAAPAFNIGLCTKFDVTPSEFDGRNAALLQEFDQQGRRHMEYLRDHGIWSDVPLERVIKDFNEIYDPGIWQRCTDERDRNAARKAANFEDEARLDA